MLKRYYSSLPSGSKHLTLQHFILKSNVKNLWRDILRSSKTVSDPSAKHELRRWAKEEILRHKNETDLHQIKFLLSVGRTDYKNLSQELGLSYVDTNPDNK